MARAGRGRLGQRLPPALQNRPAQRPGEPGAGQGRPRSPGLQVLGRGRRGGHHHLQRGQDLEALRYHGPKGRRCWRPSPPSLQARQGSGRSRGMEVVGREKLEAVAIMRPSPRPREEIRFSPGRHGYRGFDLAAWIGEHGVSVKREGPWGRDGYRWVLEECPWNGHADNAAYIVRFAGGAIAAGCHHNSCQGYDWRDLREHYEPGSYEQGEHRAEDRLRECWGPVGTLLSEVEPERIEWLWPGRIPLGKLTVVDGDPGLGKSAMTLDIAARVSAGLELPDGERCEPAGVLLMSPRTGLRTPYALAWTPPARIRSGYWR